MPSVPMFPALWQMLPGPPPAVVSFVKIGVCVLPIYRGKCNVPLTFPPELRGVCVGPLVPTKPHSGPLRPNAQLTVRQQSSRSIRSSTQLPRTPRDTGPSQIFHHSVARCRRKPRSVRSHYRTIHWSGAKVS